MEKYIAREAAVPAEKIIRCLLLLSNMLCSGGSGVAVLAGV